MMVMINKLNNNTSDYAEKLRRCQEYVDALEEERRKIQVFQRELPLCLELVTHAIEASKQQLTSSATEYYFHGGQSECSEQTTSEGPVLEEFIPIKRPSSSDDDEQQSKKPNNNHSSDNKNNSDSKASKKSDWLRSAQLWNQTPDPTPEEDHSPKKATVVEVQRNGSGGAFHPFKRDKNVGTGSTSTAQGPSSGGAKSVPPAAVGSSSVETGGSSGGGSKKEEKEGQSQRKQRRCWSPELHRRFLQALQQLGGSHAATPKQIRELMKVDGLTNDEVKSHLQKYRLHTRRPSHSIHNTTNPQAPQFVVVGGIWVPPPDQYAAMAAPDLSGEASAAPNSNAIYAPIAALPPSSNKSQKQRQQQQHKQSHSNSSHSEHGGARANSPNSSSSDTTTASPSAY